MGFFNWSAPLFGHFADRWDDADIAEISGWLRPFVQPEGRLLDVGGGTGALARRLSASLQAEVTVIDPTPEMLSYVPDVPRVHAIQGTAEAIPLEDGWADAVIVTDAFHHFRDQPAAVAEFARVVKRSGGVIVVDLDPTPWYMRLIAGAERLLGEPGAFFTPEALCAFMAKQGVAGHCERMRGPMYRYVGTVE